MEKEYKVYVVSLDDTEVVPSDIEEWQYYQQVHGKLTDGAKDFIDFAEETGRVYSLNGFTSAFNFERISDNNDLIFITNKY